MFWSDCVESWEFVEVSADFVQSAALSDQQRGRTMGPLAAPQKPKLRLLNDLTDKAELGALGPGRPATSEQRGAGTAGPKSMNQQDDRQNTQISRQFFCALKNRRTNDANNNRNLIIVFILF